MLIEVECYAGHKGEETPRRFTLGGRTVTVAEIVGAWLAPDHRYFKVTGDDGATYILRHDTETSEWEFVLYTSVDCQP